MVLPLEAPEELHKTTKKAPDWIGVPSLVATRMFSPGGIHAATNIAYSRCACRASQFVKRGTSSRDIVNHSSIEENRFNAMRIQMLPEKLKAQIFGCDMKNSELDSKLKKNKTRASIKKLEKFDLWGKRPEILPNVEFDLPHLKGDNIDEHFKVIGTEQCASYVQLVLELTASELPEKPKIWSKKPGWTKYDAQGNGKFNSVCVEYPNEQAMVFDCEVLVTENEFPVMAIAVSPTHWYSWCSSRVSALNPALLEPGIESLIPMEAGRSTPCAPDLASRIIIGHNISYDRVRIKEQYYIHQSGIRFLDTMSMHIAVSGFSGDQRNLYKASNGKDHSSWLGSGSMNSLADVHKFYCGRGLEKEMRNLFVKGDMSDVRENFQDLMRYCANDVEATCNVVKKLFPIFCNRFPHPVTMAAVFEMGMMYLPTNKSWSRFKNSADNTYSDLNKELKSLLIDIANEACILLHGEKFKKDKWLWNLDWTTRSFKLLKTSRKDWVATQYKDPDGIPEPCKLGDEEKLFLDMPAEKSKYRPSPLMQSLLDTAASLPKVAANLPGYPKWYTDLCMRASDPDWKPGPVDLSTLTKITPKLLRMTWNGHVLHHDRFAGWGYLVPAGAKPQRLDEKLETIDIDDEIDSDWDVQSDNTVQDAEPVDVPDLPEGYLFYKLPHKLGKNYNVGSPLSHDFLPKMDDGTLGSVDDKGAARCLEINQACSYWRGARQRVHSQMPINLPEQALPLAITNQPQYGRDSLGAIIPKTVVIGAVSRRAVEPTWLTASNVREKSIGSELKAMIQSPPGYSFVGADVDSQELWIASLLGDANCAKEHGCTPISWMTLQGSKANGTDMHSTTANAIGTSRHQAKIFNYARIYGGGQRLAKMLLIKNHPNMSLQQAHEKITKLYTLTKGTRKYLLSTDGRYFANKLQVKINPLASSRGLVTYNEVKMLESAAKASYGHLIDMSAKSLIAGTVWEGGTESDMFNKLEKIARSMNPRTPFLDARISTALEPSRVQGNFLPTRMNWVVQSSAVDYLHLLLVCMRWLIKTYDIKARFAISIHDDLRYLCLEEDRYRTAMALQIANVLTRSMFAYKVGMDDLPLGVAFFSSVEIDKALRKDHRDDCVTPSNPLGLQRSCGIGHGTSLDIFDILQKTNGGSLVANP